jgi:peptide/nickel transport system permease protein
MNRGARTWLRFVVRRVGTLVVVLVLLISFSFFVTRRLGTPLYLMVGAQASQEILEAAKSQLGVDQPLWKQYLNYMRSVAHGNFGVSRFTYNKVTTDIARRLPATLELATIALVLTTLLGIAGGMAAAIKQEGLLGRLVNGLSSVGVSVDQPWFALMLIWVLFFILSVAPSPVGRIGTQFQSIPRPTGFLLLDTLLDGNVRAFGSAVSHLALPIIAMVFTTVPYILQLVRSNAMQALRSPYIQNARAFGLSRGTQYRYVLRNMLPSLLTLVAVNYAWLISANVIIEQIYSWPGLGQYIIQAMNNSDYDPVIAIVLLAATVYTLLYFVVDVVSAIVDPRWKID